MKSNYEYKKPVILVQGKQMRSNASNFTDKFRPSLSLTKVLRIRCWRPNFVENLVSHPNFKQNWSQWLYTTYIIN